MNKNFFHNIYYWISTVFVPLGEMSSNITFKKDKVPLRNECNYYLRNLDKVFFLYLPEVNNFRVIE